jgi:hypothetical protein
MHYYMTFKLGVLELEVGSHPGSATSWQCDGEQFATSLKLCPHHEMSTVTPHSQRFSLWIKMLLLVKFLSDPE